MPLIKTDCLVIVDSVFLLLFNRVSRGGCAEIEVSPLTTGGLLKSRRLKDYLWRRNSQRFSLGGSLMSVSLQYPQDRLLLLPVSSGKG